MTRPPGPPHRHPVTLWPALGKPQTITSTIRRDCSTASPPTSRGPDRPAHPPPAAASQFDDLISWTPTAALHCTLRDGAAEQPSTDRDCSATPRCFVRLRTMPGSGAYYRQNAACVHSAASTGRAAAGGAAAFRATACCRNRHALPAHAVRRVLGLNHALRIDADEGWNWSRAVQPLRPTPGGLLQWTPNSKLPFTDVNDFNFPRRCTTTPSTTIPTGSKRASRT